MTPLNEASWHDGRLQFDRRHWRCEALDFDWRAEGHLIVVTEVGQTTETQVKFADGTSFRGCDRSGVASVVPAFLQRKASYRRADMVFSALWIEPTLASELFEGSMLPDACVNVDNPVPGALFKSLNDELAAGSMPEAIYVEHLAQFLIANLMRPQLRKPVAGTVSQRRREQVRDYIEANLSCPIRLTDLARVANMPVDAFTRAFKASTGTTPHAFVVDCRIARAQFLLRADARSISAVAFACGFSSQSHLTSVFRRATGLTPKAYRAQFSPQF